MKHQAKLGICLIFALMFWAVIPGIASANGIPLKEVTRNFFMLFLGGLIWFGLTEILGDK